MDAILALMQAIQSQVSDPVRDAVVKALASYAGLSALVVSLVSGIKRLWPKRVENREPAIAVALTYLLGIVAKLAIPSIYGGNDVGSWALHGVVLLVVAIGAKQIHDGILNAFKKPKIDPPAPPPTQPPAPPGA